jgi:hypothetical protein
MKLADYIYYCIYRFILKTPARKGADAWPGVFLALTSVIHLMAIYFVLAVTFKGVSIPIGELKLVVCGLMILLLGLSFRLYVWKARGIQVIKSFEKLGHKNRYAIIGFILFVETTILPLSMSVFFIFSSRLIGWPAPVY